MQDKMDCSCGRFVGEPGEGCRCECHPENAPSHTEMALRRAFRQVKAAFPKEPRPQTDFTLY